jgi:hypothetical protein
MAHPGLEGRRDLDPVTAVGRRDRLRLGWMEATARGGRNEEGSIVEWFQHYSGRLLGTTLEHPLFQRQVTSRPYNGAGDNARKIRVGYAAASAS